MPKNKSIDEQMQQAIDELSTVQDLLRFGYTQFQSHELYYGHGTDNAWDEIVFLVCSALYLPFQNNTHFLAAKLTRKERENLVGLIQQRVISRKPVPYLINRAYFAGLEFYVDERVLIPRSPMAELIENHFAPWLQEPTVHNILDLCTGSGCIAIACAYAFPDAFVDASDISKEALDVAEINVEKHKLSSQVSLIQSNLFEHIPLKRYDLIISNPPYVSEGECATLPKEYYYEPQLAFEAGKEGLDLVKVILKQAKHYLSPQGVLIVEVGNAQEELINTFPQVPFVWLHFARGEDGVFLLTAKDLAKIDFDSF